MRVLLISEGFHEGDPDADKSQALRAIVQRVLPLGTEFTWISVLHLPRGNPFPGQNDGHVKLALKAMWYATKNRFDAVVLITDADRKHERITQFDQAQGSTHFSIPRALGIPVEAFDAWILADQKALSQVLEATVPLPRLPERYTGGKGSPQHPKQVCKALMRKFGWTRRQREFYEAVCQCADLEVMAKRCPKGFRPFWERLKEIPSG